MLNARTSLAFACLLFACSGDDTPPAVPDDASTSDGAPQPGDSGSDGAVTDGGTPGSRDGGGAGDAGPSSPAEDAGAAWAAVDALMAAASAAENDPGIALAVYDAADRRVFYKAYGDFAAEREVAIASSSKLVSGLVLFDLVRAGALSLDSTTGEVLGWTGENGAITLRHLLSFTSGLDPESPCTLNPFGTLESCAAAISRAATLAPPGQRFDYGSTHLQVAARMAEVASGKSWNDLFRATLGDPLGLPSTVRYYTAPKQQNGTQNPLIAGGMRASMNDYAKLLALDFHSGRYGGLTIGTDALFEAQAREPYPDVAIGNSPRARRGDDARYGLTAWLECATPATGCEVLSSPGAFGFTPWLDREHGYYAVLGMELDGATNGVVAFAVTLADQLRPAIITALAAQ
jgi:serine-type D-Ala-D-Ala carboxypeptidase/endopeptidase